MTQSEKDAIRRARAEYRREWNRKHPDKQREYQERYWLKRAAQNEAEAKGGAGDAAQE